MNLYELHHTMERQTALRAEIQREQWIGKHRQGNPSRVQRMLMAVIVTVGESLEQAGRWMKRHASPATSAAASRNMDPGLPVPR